MSPETTALAAVARAIEARIPAAGAPPLVLGLCGAQGSGKSTLATGLATHFDTLGVAVLSIDDLYRTKAERAALARDIHPLLRTRGVPGTHDVALGLAVCAQLDQHRPTALPRFDKAADDRAPRAEWPEAPAGTRLLILEGWCVGALPQPEGDLRAPINALERDEDPHGVWRRHVNAALSRDYQRLFARIDLLVLLAAPGFAVVQAWRTQQEHDLRARTGAGMADGEIARFIAHYERLTRHILTEMPGRADLVIRLGADRTPLSIDPPAP